MKKMKCLLALCALALLLAGCQGGKETAKERLPLADAAGAVLKDRDSLVNIPEEDLYDLIGIEPEDYTEVLYLASENGLSAREAIVLRARDADAAKRIADALNAYLGHRMDETRNYLPEEYKILSQAKVEEKNNTVALITGENAAEEARALLAGE